MVYAATLGMPPRQESRTGWTANRMGISLSKTHSRLRKLVDSRSQQVIRSVAPGIKRALIIGKKNDHIRLSPKNGPCHKEKKKSFHTTNQIEKVSQSIKLNQVGST
jgi:hypothetical protein